MKQVVTKQLVPPVGDFDRKRKLGVDTLRSINPGLIPQSEPLLLSVPRYEEKPAHLISL